MSDAVLDEVVGPNVIGTFWPTPYAPAIVQPKPSFLSTFLRDFQLLVSSNAHGSDVFQVLVSFVQKNRYHAISVPLIFVGQPLFIGHVLWQLALYRSMLPKCAAGPTLWHTQFLFRVGDAFATMRRAYKFPFDVSVRMGLSMERSDTIRRSR